MVEGKGKLRREDQQYSEWLRAELVCQGRKTMAIISGNARNQPPWWKKNQPTHGKEESVPKRGGDNNDAHSTMEAENYMDNFKVIKRGGSRVVCDQVEGQSNVVSGRQVLKHTKPGLEVRLDEEVVGLSLQDKCTPS